jgi:allantoicase
LSISIVSTSPLSILLAYPVFSITIRSVFLVYLTFPTAILTMDVQSLSLETIQDTTTSPQTPTPSIIITPISPADLALASTFSTLTQLTTSTLHARILSCSDEYFAAASNLLTPGPPLRKPGYFVHTGAWYDGWETRRHNPKEFDWVVVQLGCVGRIEAVEVDTAYFNGNEAPEVSVEGCYLPGGGDGSGVNGEGFKGWKEVMARQPCGPSMRQGWWVGGPGVTGEQFTHLRLRMFPDGGIARLRVYGEVVPPPLAEGTMAERPLEDLVSALNGGVAIACSDQHFGGKNYLVLPGRGKDMGDGWETARNRTKGHVDWVICRLGLRGKVIEKLVVDTKDFRGNFPRGVRVDGYSMESAKAAMGREDDPREDDEGWVPVVKGEKACRADTEHVFEGEDLVQHGVLEGRVWTHVKMTIIPDGGVKRIRVFGRRA